MYKLPGYLLAATLLAGCAGAPTLSERLTGLLPINESAGQGILECTRGDSRYRINLDRSTLQRKFPLDQNGARATLFVEDVGRERLFFGEYHPSIKPDTRGPGHYDLG